MKRAAHFQRLIVAQQVSRNAESKAHPATTRQREAPFRPNTKNAYFASVPTRVAYEESRVVYSNETRTETNMWPFGDSETVESNISVHASYSMDGAFIIIIVIAVVAYMWRKNTKRIRELEEASRQRRMLESPA